MKLHELKSTPNSRFAKTRKGRGMAAGKGKTAGRGQNGQNARTGGGTRLGFEGGQNLWYRRLPKRGFNNINHIEYQVVNLNDLNTAFENDETVDVNSLKSKGLIKKMNLPIKILGRGSLEKKLNIKVDALSKKALENIIRNGGSQIK